MIREPVNPLPDKTVVRGAIVRDGALEPCISRRNELPAADIERNR